MCILCQYLSSALINQNNNNKTRNFVNIKGKCLIVTLFRPPIIHKTYCSLRRIREYNFLFSNKISLKSIVHERDQRRDNELNKEQISINNQHCCLIFIKNAGARRVIFLVSLGNGSGNIDCRLTSPGDASLPANPTHTVRIEWQH